MPISGFYPRPRAGGDGCGADHVARNGGVSIHAPVQGATACKRAYVGQRFCFYPRPRAGGDEALGTQIDYSRVVSIHAPVQGATLT